MKLQQYLNALLIAAMTFTLIACGGGGGNTTTTPTTNPTPMNTGDDAPISAGDDIDPSTYSLDKLDEINTKYQAKNGIKTGLKRFNTKSATNPNLTPDNGMFFLGNGFDVINNSLGETCLNVEDEAFKIIKTPSSKENTFLVEYTDNKETLAKMLDVDVSLAVAYHSKVADAEVTAAYHRFEQSFKSRNHIQWVIKVNIFEEEWQLNTPIDSIHPALVSNMLEPADENAQARFRHRCGDKYVDGATLGASLYIVFSMDATKYTEDERNDIAVAVQGKFQKFEGNAAYSQSEEYNSTIDNYNITMKAFQVGGPENLMADVNVHNISEKYDRFINETNKDNWRAVSMKTKDYQIPDAYKEYSKEQVFAKYQDPYTEITRYAVLSNLHKERCDAWGDYGQRTPDVCRVTANELVIAMDKCRQLSEWEHCVQPQNYEVTGKGNLYAWIANSIEDLEVQPAKSETHSIKSATFKSHIGEFETCLPNSRCFFNKFKGEKQGYTYSFSKERNTEKRSHTIQGHCVRSKGTAKLPNGWWNFDIEIHGVCPVVKDFEL